MDMKQLAEMECVPCKGGTPLLQGEALQHISDQLGHGWQVVDGHHLHKRFRFADFPQALAFVDAIGQLAERVNHHPDLCLGWGYTEVTLWTHKIGGLSEADFVFAAKVEALAQS
jgi:4a-hydroxytetrahydrobiopterin dehydratase